MADEQVRSHPLCIALIATYLPHLEELRARLGARFPEARLGINQAESHSFIIYLDCMFQRDVPGACDNVALVIEVFHLDGTPRINASIDWGSLERADPLPDWSSHMPPDFYDSWRSSDEWPEANPETLRRLEGDFPRLMKGFEAIVTRACALLAPA